MTNKYEQWVDQKFHGLTRDELREAGGVFGLTFGPNTSEATMRTKLCEKVGQQPVPEMAAAPVAKAGKKPNLTPLGTWEGRRRRVILTRGSTEAQHKAKILIWECVSRAFPYDEIVDMPNPYFEVLKNAKSAHVYQKPVRDEEGRLLSMKREETPFDVHAYRDLGVTPGTENLPLDLQDYWKQQAEQNAYFEKYSRNALINIRSDFVGAVGMQTYRDLTNEDIRADILRHCGLEHAAFQIEGLAA